MACEGLPLVFFSDFTKSVAYKKLSIINQYWEDGRPIDMYGSSYSEVKHWDRSLLDDLDYWITIINSDDMENATTATNQVAMEIFGKGAQNARALLEVGTWPQQFKDKALRILDQQEAAMAQQQADAQQLAQLQQGMPQQGNMRQMQDQMMNGNIQSIV